MFFGLILMGLTALFLLTFILGFVEDDPEITENVAGFVIMFAALGIPGLILIRRARRGR